MKREMWVNPLIRQEKIDYYLNGDSNEVIFSRKRSMQKPDGTSREANAELKRGQLLALLSEIQADSFAKRLALEASQQATEHFEKDLSPPSFEDDKFIVFAGGVRQLAPEIALTDLRYWDLEVAIILMGILISISNRS